MHPSRRLTQAGRSPVFDRARALLHPNEHFREPFGLAPVEAQACGCPVIAWDHGALRETVVPGESGLLVRTEAEFAAAVRAGAADGYSAAACRASAERFGAEGMGRRYDELLREATSGVGW